MTKRCKKSLSKEIGTFTSKKTLFYVPASSQELTQEDVWTSLTTGVLEHAVLEERWVQSSGGGASGGMHVSAQTAVA
jgi:hypothetical protein